jgi:hypothetical protein
MGNHLEHLMQDATSSKVMADQGISPTQVIVQKVNATPLVLNAVGGLDMLCQLIENH